jgi:Pyruvate/2-oxoacid:ferredoxin oxidoreductase delta subunit
MNKSQSEVESAVELMAKEGKVLVMKSRKDGQKYYALFPVLAGLLESVYADGIDDGQRRKLSKLTDKYFFDKGGWNGQFSSDYPKLRIIPVEETVEGRSRVLAFEEVSQIIEEAETITVIPCHCRSIKKKCDHLMEADFVFGAWAAYLIEYRGGRRWTKQEALKRLHECEEEGLVHLTGNFQKGNGVICNCCTCCCFALRGFTELNNRRSFVRTNFEPHIDSETCNLCALCESDCPMDAIKELPGHAEDGADSKMIIEDNQCIGCGLCASHCPEAAISMVKVRDYVPVQSYREMNEQFLKGA